VSEPARALAWARKLSEFLIRDARWGACPLSVMEKWPTSRSRTMRVIKDCGVSRVRQE